MEIEDTIQTLTRIRQSIVTWVPKRTTSPDALIEYLNDLYIAAAEDSEFDDLFEHDDVGGPSITLIVSVDMGFDLPNVMEKMRTRLHIEPPEHTDEIGKAGIVWSHGRYDFVFDDNAGLLRISHRYSHRRIDTKSVSSIAEQMIDYAIDYLSEVKASTTESPDASETD